MLTGLAVAGMKKKCFTWTGRNQNILERLPCRRTESVYVASNPSDISGESQRTAACIREKLFFSSFKSVKQQLVKQRDPTVRYSFSKLLRSAPLKLSCVPGCSCFPTNLQGSYLSVYTESKRHFRSQHCLTWTSWVQM